MGNCRPIRCAGCRRSRPGKAASKSVRVCIVRSRDVRTEIPAGIDPRLRSFKTGYHDGADCVASSWPLRRPARMATISAQTACDRGANVPGVVLKAAAETARGAKRTSGDAWPAQLLSAITPGSEPNRAPSRFRRIGDRAGGPEPHEPSPWPRLFPTLPRSTPRLRRDQSLTNGSMFRNRRPPEQYRLSITTPRARRRGTPSRPDHRAPEQAN
jgi:hypothetical protein